MLKPTVVNVSLINGELQNSFIVGFVSWLKWLDFLPKLSSLNKLDVSHQRLNEIILYIYIFNSFLLYVRTQPSPFKFQCEMDLVVSVWSVLVRWLKRLYYLLGALLFVRELGTLFWPGFHLLLLVDSFWCNMKACQVNSEEAICGFFSSSSPQKEYK